MDNPTPLSFIIRDGLPSDYAACLALDHRYSTEHVWQMILQPELNGWSISFRAERLPRAVETLYQVDMAQLAQTEHSHYGFLVAVDKATDELLAYLILSQDTLYPLATIHDLVVHQPFRKVGIGSRLVTVARRWAQERQLRRLQTIVQTQNYPAIQFCQSNNFSFCGYNDQYLPNQDIVVFFSQSLR